MRLIKINLNHCEAAQGLLSQTIYDEGTEAAIISEPYRKNKNGAELQMYLARRQYGRVEIKPLKK